MSNSFLFYSQVKTVLKIFVQTPYCFLFSKIIFENSLLNTFLTIKQHKTIFLLLFSKIILKNKNKNKNKM